ncbi:hypothetical protein BaRGS_00035342 [Batillaria attramentaria]|uniref:Uncharacterized protein n=1 Tax=Batillaria attramentaria TaxID=370345 RepID=A0ABD0JEX7_9CAEN
MQKQVDDKDNTNNESSVLMEIPEDHASIPREPSSPSVSQIMPDTSLLPAVIADGEAGHVSDNNSRHVIQTTAELNPITIGQDTPRSWSAVVFGVAAPVAPYCNFPPPSSVVDTRIASIQQESNYVPMYRSVVSSARHDSVTVVVSPTGDTDTGTEVVPLYENNGCSLYENTVLSRAAKQEIRFCKVKESSC